MDVRVSVGRWGRVAALAGWLAAADAEAARWTLIDFGPSDATTQMPYPAWTNLLRHPTRTRYVAPDGIPGHAGVTETAGIPAGQWAYYGVRGTAGIDFRPGQTIVATFYNNSDEYLFLEARVSFTDEDAPDPAETNRTWFTMQNRRYEADSDWMPPRELVELEYYISDSNRVSSLTGLWSAGSHRVVNLSKPYNEARFLLTKIELTDEADLTPPTAPAGLTATLTETTAGAGSNLVALSWSASTDPGARATGVSRYLIYRDDRLLDVLSEDEVAAQGARLLYTDLCVAPTTAYRYAVSALDDAPYGLYPTKADMTRRVGNESARAGPVAITTGAWRASSLLDPSAQLQYLGGFRLPAGMEDDWSYAAGGLACRPDGNPGHDPAREWAGSLFAYTQIQRAIAEISVPVPVLSSHVDELPRARLLRGPTNLWPRIYGGADPTVPPGGTDYKVAGLAYHPAANGVAARLYYGVCNFYGSAGTVPSHGSFALDLASSVGAWHVGGTPPGHVYPGVCARIAFAAPSDWAARHAGGRSLIVGGMFLSGGEVNRHGPSLYAVAPWESGALPGNGGAVSAVNLLGYSELPALEHRVINWARDEFGEGGAWLQARARSAVALSYRRSIGDLWYGDSLGNLHATWDIPEPPMGDKGVGASYWKTGLMLYNPDDLAAVAAGTKAAWEPQPYVVFDLDRFSLKPGGGDGQAGAVAYDSSNNRLFFIEHNGDPGYEQGYALIHVWRVAAPFQPSIAIRPLGGAAMELRWTTEAGAGTYQVQSSSDLPAGAWTDEGTPVDGAGTDRLATNTPPAGVRTRAYRVRVVP